MRRVTVTKPTELRVMPMSVMARVRRSIAASNLQFSQELLDAEWVDVATKSGMTWRAGNYWVEVSGSQLFIHRVWSTPIRF